MSLPKLPPELAAFATQTKARLTTLERRLDTALAGVDDRDTFDLVGQIFVSTSGNLPLIVAKRAVAFHVTLADFGDGGPTTVELRRNGDQVAEVQFADGAIRIELGLDVKYDATDLVSVACTEAADGAESLVAVVHWRPSG